MNRPSLADGKQKSFLRTLLGLFVVLGFFYAMVSMLGEPEESLTLSSQTVPPEASRNPQKQSSKVQRKNEGKAGISDTSASLASANQDKKKAQADLLFQRALVALHQNSDDEARALLKDVLRQDPNHIAAAEELYASFEKARDFEGALATLQKLELETTHSDHAGLDYSQGRLYLDLGHPDMARVHLEKALQTEADHPLIREQLAAAYNHLGDREMAQREWQILAQDESAGQASLNAKAQLAELFFAEGRHAEAEYYAKEVLRQDPQHRLGILISGR